MEIPKDVIKQIKRLKKATPGGRPKYPDYLKEKIISLLDHFSIDDLANALNIHQTSIRKWRGLIQSNSTPKRVEIIPFGPTGKLIRMRTPKGLIVEFEEEAQAIQFIKRYEVA